MEDLKDAVDQLDFHLLYVFNMRHIKGRYGVLQKLK